MITRYEEQMYNDIHRIANALEKIAKSLENPLRNQEQQMVSGHIDSDIKPLVMCPKCHSINVKALYETINLDGSGHLRHYICEDCHKEFEV